MIYINMERRILDTNIQTEELKLENNLRPQFLNSYIGQDKIKSAMKVYIDAAKGKRDGR